MDDSLHIRGNFPRTPVRRKSMLKLAGNTAFVNDDDAELQARRFSTSASPLTTNSAPNDKRRSLGLSSLSNVSVQEMNKKMAECIKLNTQNKINMKNAFSLEMIDFMAYLITKQDKTTTTLQMATTSLDVSSKIYGFRVDGVHAEVLRIMCSMEEQNKKGSGKATAEEGQEPGENENSQESQPRKKRKQNKKRILATPESLRTVVQTAKPSLLAMCETDVRTSDSLSQAILPLHSTSSFFLQPYDDIILDSVPEEQPPNGNQTCTIRKIEDFTDTEICPALSNFKFLDELEDDPVEMEQDDVNRSDNIYRFDLEASVQESDDHVQTANYFDMEQSGDVVEEVQLCANAGREAEKIVDFSGILGNSRLVNTIGQYSVVPKSLNIHWAGPSHWKLRTVGKPSVNSSIETRTAQKSARKKKILDLIYDPDITEDAKSKFVPSYAANLQPLTTRAGWSAGRVNLPWDVHYDIKQACKCYLHGKVLSCFDDEPKDQSTEAATIGEHCDYDGNDLSGDGPDVHAEDFLPDTQADDFLPNTQAGTGPDELMPNSQMPFTKDNLVAQPKLAKKIAIGYSTRVKKVDMRELKNTIWNSLANGPRTANSNEEGTSEQAIPESISQGIQFNKVYKELPGKLVKTKPDALSFAISFVSLLHLANEKSLVVTSASDMSDIIVKTE